MWWLEISSLRENLEAELGAVPGRIEPSANIEPGSTIDERAGPVAIGARTTICAGAIIRGPIIIGSDCLVGNHAVVRGPSRIGDRVRIGFATEIKQSLIADRVTIGPVCYIGDSKVDDGVYLGALVRTSNHRFDQQPVTVRAGETQVATGIEKLGCWIGARAVLGIQVIVLPGRVVAADSVFEPRVTIERNLPRGRYRIKQTLESVE